MDLEIDRAIILKYYPDFLKFGSVFKLTEEKGYYRINTYHWDTKNKSLNKIDHTCATARGNLGHIREEQLNLNLIKETIREVIREELNNFVIK